jgi:hypothetical protein
VKVNTLYLFCQDVEIRLEGKRNLPKNKKYSYTTYTAQKMFFFFRTRMLHEWLIVTFSVMEKYKIIHKIHE